MDFAILAAGLVLLAVGGDSLVNGATQIAQKLNVPNLIIGLTIVAFGTSAPELMVSVEAAILGAPDLAVGNIIGSNITNALIVIGLPALLSTMPLNQYGLRRNGVFLIIATLLFFAIIRDGQIDRVDAALLLFGTLAFLIASAITSRKSPNSDQQSAGSSAKLSTLKAIALTIFGIAALTFGGKLTVDGALGIAAFFHVKHAAVGLTIVALGTSLPELAAGVAAARKKEHGLLLGNVLGSNIFNMLTIAGITAAIAPLPVAPLLVQHDVIVMIVSSVFLVALIFRQKPIGRVVGLIFSLAYIAYMIEVLAFRVAS